MTAGAAGSLWHRVEVLGATWSFPAPTGAVGTPHIWSGTARWKPAPQAPGMLPALELRKAIAAAQLAVGLRVSGVSSFVPHVTLQHAHQIDSIEKSIPPIRWPLRDFVLIRTFFGHSRHEVAGCWPLACVPDKPVVDLLAEMANLPDLPDPW